MRKTFAITILLTVSLAARAQYDPVLSHYFDMEPQFNAAAVGKMVYSKGGRAEDSKVNIDVAYNMALVGYENNPNTIYAAADTPFYFLKMYHGAGLEFMSDNLGVFSHQRLNIQYAAKMHLFGGQLAIGARVGLLMETLKGEKVDLEDSGDPAFSSSNQTGNGFDLGVGLYFNHRNFYVGASVEHLTSPTISLGETNELKVDAMYYFTAGYNIRLRNPFLTIKPSVLFRTDFTTYRGDITARLQYTHEKRMMYIGLGYSPTNSVSLFIGGNFHGVIVAYSYEYYTSGISFINGGHELLIGYQLDLNLVKKGRNYHQSTRIL